MNIKKDGRNICNFIFELSQLKRIRHEGWHLIGAKNIDSVAEHTLRAAQIGYVLAMMEKHENPAEVASLLIFHDIEECRIGDIHKVANRYVSADGERAVREQTKPLGDIGKNIFGLWNQCEAKDTKAGIIAKDADLLEQAFEAKELLERGYSYAEVWIKNVSDYVKTESAKKLLASLRNAHPDEWWQDFVKLDKTSKAK